jgi:hypothetical protein
MPTRPTCPAPSLPGTCATCTWKTTCACRASWNVRHKADLGRVDMPAFIYASREDHIVPWKSAYQSRKPARRRDDLRAGRLGAYCRRDQPATKNKRSHWLQRQHHRERRRMVRHRDRGQGQLVAGVGQWLKQHAGGERRRAPKKPGQQGLPAGRAGAGKLRQGKGMRVRRNLWGRGWRQDNASPDPTKSRGEENGEWHW